MTRKAGGGRARMPFSPPNSQAAPKHARRPTTATTASSTLPAPCSCCTTWRTRVRGAGLVAPSAGWLLALAPCWVTPLVQACSMRLMARPAHAF